VAHSLACVGRIGNNHRIVEQVTFSDDKARAIGEAIGIDWNGSRFDVAQFRMGLEVELEHGRRDPATNVSDDDELTTGKIALAHLTEFPDYYTRLAQMEAEAQRYWAERDSDSGRGT
jgi:hypothetical protein